MVARLQRVPRRHRVVGLLEEMRVVPEGDRRAGVPELAREVIVEIRRVDTRIEGVNTRIEGLDRELRTAIDIRERLAALEARRSA